MTIFYRQLAEVPADRDWLQRPDSELIAPLRAAYYSPEELSPERVGPLASWLRRYLGTLIDRGTPQAERLARMRAANPKYVLRNYLAQLAIDEVERGETSKLLELLELLRRPYDDQPGRDELAQKRPDWARQRAGCSMLSCSS